ncbi:MAG: hypothetical protein V8R55_04305 [Dysosmobacter sp.]
MSITVRAFRDGVDVVHRSDGQRPRHAGGGGGAGPAGGRRHPHSGAKGSGIGFRNVHQRLRLTLGRAYGLTILSEPDYGTAVRIRLPALDEEAAAPYRKEERP